MGATLTGDTDGRTLTHDDTNRWEVEEAYKWMAHLAQFKPLWIEEPTSPDDILGHKLISEELKDHDIMVATGEHCQNR